MRLVGPRGEGEGDDRRRGGRQAGEEGGEAGEGARLREPAACVGDMIYMPERRSGKDRVAGPAECPWVEDDEVLVAISKTGRGRSFVAQAIGNAARGRLLPTRCVRLADLCAELNRARLAKGGAHFRLTDLRTGGELIADSILGRVASACGCLDIDGPNMRKWIADNRPKRE